MNNKYVLATATARGSVTYWTGQYTDAGKPATKANIDDAKTFDSSVKAYYAGTINKGLGLFRAIRLYSNNTDGFISHWWLPDIEE
jgi:hypothetical protein